MMATRKKEADLFPPECCGVCARAVLQQEGGDLLCFAGHPEPIIDGEANVFWVRGAPVDPPDPACVDFKPRCHAMIATSPSWRRWFLPVMWQGRTGK